MYNIVELSNTLFYNYGVGH